MNRLILCLALVVMPVLLVSCGSDDDGLKYADQTMVVGSRYSIPGGSDGWESDNELIASVTSSGVCAEHVGETYIRNGRNAFKVTVTGKYNLYMEPYLHWGASKSTVKSFMTGYNLQIDEDDMLFYERDEFSIAYSFESNRLTAAGVFLASAMVNYYDLLEYLEERYIYLEKDEESGSLGYVTPDRCTIVVIQKVEIESEMFYVVAYIDIETNSSSPTKTLDYSKRFIHNSQLSSLKVLRR